MATMKCELPKDINNCPYCKKENMECMNKDTCSFQEKEEKSASETFSREERWYEKYYKK